MPNQIAIASTDAVVTYSELQALALRIRQHRCLINTDRPLLIIHTDQSISTLQVVSLCWMAGIPFLIVHPSDDDNPEGVVASLGLHPSLIVSTQTLTSGNIPFVKPDEFLQQIKESNSVSDFRSRPDDIALILSTSGSTGFPKQVVFKRNQLMAAALSSQPFMQPAPENYWLLNLPLNHAGGLGILIRCLIWKSSVWFSSAKESNEVARLLIDNPAIDTISLVPTQLHRLLAEGFIKPLSKLKIILIGAGSVSDGDLNTINHHQLPIRQSFGMTETFGHFTLSESASDQHLVRSDCGAPLPGNEIQIRDDAGNLVPQGTSGSLWIRGNQLFDRYTKPSMNHFDDRWFQTGDFGYTDEQNHFYFEARRTDIIKTGGESVNALRLSQALQKLDGIDDALAIGLSDDEWGQRVHACLVSHAAHRYTLKELRSALRNTLKSYELPRSISWHKSIPRNSMGKVDWAALLDQIRTA